MSINSNLITSSYALIGDVYCITIELHRVACFSSNPQVRSEANSVSSQLMEEAHKLRFLLNYWHDYEPRDLTPRGEKENKRYDAADRIEFSYRYADKMRQVCFDQLDYLRSLFGAEYAEASQITFRMSDLEKLEYYEEHGLEPFHILDLDDEAARLFERALLYEAKAKALYTKIDQAFEAAQRAQLRTLK